MEIFGDTAGCRQAEIEGEQTVDFLRLVNETTGTGNLVRVAATFFQHVTGCQTAGIRLKEGDDYPYCEARGFPPAFVRMENSLCQRDAAGCVVRETSGDPVLDCMCGCVIRGRADPAKPFFTEAGSFWTNSTTGLLATTTGEDRQGRTRNRCNGEGYESVALIPLRAGAERLGLLQLNDRRGGIFSPETIGRWERLAGYLAVALAKSRAEEALRDSEERLRYHVDNSPLAVIEWGPDMRLIRWSGEAERIFGWKAWEVLGKRIEDFRWVYREDIPQVAEVSADLQCGANPRRFSANRNYRKDGSIAHCEWYNSSLLDGSGKLRSILSLVLDVTGRNLAEESARHRNAVLDGINRIFSQALSCDTEEDLGRACLRVAEAVTESRFGFIGEFNANGRLDNIAIGDAGWDACRMVNPAGRGEVPMGLEIHGIYGKVVADGKGFFTNDPASHPDRIGTPPGHPPLTAFLGAPLVHAGNAIGMVGLGNREGGYRPQDLEALEALAAAMVQVFLRRRAERAVRAGENRLREAQRRESIGLLAGGIAHDFNNLLVGVIGNASLARELLPAGHDAAELLERIVKTGEHAAHLTRQMLAYSGKGRFIIEPVNLSELFEEISGLVQPAISKQIALHLNLARDLPPVEADRSQMQQIFTNLVLNASEAIGDRRGLISVATGVRDLDAPGCHDEFEGQEIRPGRHVYLEVRDTGCGMDEATKARIFDPFFTTKFTGRGLGLAAVAGIVRSHRGAIKVSSTPAKGSCFVILLPAAAASPAAPGAASREREDLRGTGTILVVDDERVVRQMARQALERYGYDVLLAESGAAAVELFRREPGRIRTVVLDMSMPGMNGQETLRELQKVRPEVDVLISSGYSEAETLRLFEAARIAGFIQKPYTAQELARKVKSAFA